MPDFYGVLGVDTLASQADIKQAYRKLAKQFHPDINPGPEAKARFIAIQTAYDTLGDPRTRKLYDWKRQAAQAPTVSRPASPPPPPRPRQQPIYRKEPDLTKTLYYIRLWSLILGVFALLLLLDFGLATWTPWGTVRTIKHTNEESSTSRLSIRTTQAIFTVPAHGMENVKPGDQLRAKLTPIFKIGMRVGQKPGNDYSTEYEFHPKSGTSFNIYPWLVAFLLLLSAINLGFRLNSTTTILLGLIGGWVLMAVIVFIFL